MISNFAQKERTWVIQDAEKQINKFGIKHQTTKQKVAMHA